MRFARVKSDNIYLLWPQRMLGYFWYVTSKVARLFLVRDWQSRVAGYEGHVTDPWLKFWRLSCVPMKTVFCPKNRTVGTSPGHVRDMSGTSATKVIYGAAVAWTWGTFLLIFHSSHLHYLHLILILFCQVQSILCNIYYHFVIFPWLGHSSFSSRVYYWGSETNRIFTPWLSYSAIKFWVSSWDYKIPFYW